MGDPQAKFETRKEKKRPSEVDPQAKFETRTEKNDPAKWIHKRNLRPERKKTTQRSGSTSEILDQKGKKRPSEGDPQAKFETRKEKNDQAKWIHKRNLRPERKKTTKRSGSTSEI